MNDSPDEPRQTILTKEIDMFGTITAVASASAPYVVQGALQAGKAVTGMAIAAKASNYANGQLQDLLITFQDTAKTARRVTKEEMRGSDTDNVTPVTRSA